jgi:hypothetical protein
MKIIFLDVDGVLNSGRSFIAFAKNSRAAEYADDPYWFKITKATIDPVSVGLLNRVLEDFDAHFVLSSTHRMYFEDGPDKLQKIKGYMNHIGVLGDRCIGYTPRFNAIRGEEIQHWIEENKDLYTIENMIILDDSSDFLQEQMEFHVHCKGGHGITEENYRQMTRLFGREDSSLVFM